MRKTLMAAVLLAAMLIFGVACAEEAGTVVQTSCSIVQSGEYYLVYCFAQVHNNTDDVICLEKGIFDLHSGEQILATEEVSQLWPYFISPGEDGYLFEIVSFEPGENGPVVPNVTGIDFNIEYMSVDAAHASIALETQAQVVDDPDGAMVICRVQNPNRTDAFDPAVAFGLYAQSGALLYTQGMTLKDVGIPAGGEVLVRFPLDRGFLEQWESYGAPPSHAVVKACFRMDED